VSDQVTIGDYSLEISGDEIVVRDESGAIVETLDLDEIEGELTLPDGKKIDLAAILADNDLDAFQTAAGPANDNAAFVNGGPANFTPFRGTPDEPDGLNSAGTLDGTSLAFDALADVAHAANDFQVPQQTRSSFDWSLHDIDPVPNEPSDKPSGPQNPSGRNQSGDNDEDEHVASPPDLPSQDGGPSSTSGDGDSATPPTDGQQLNEDESYEPSTPPTDERQELADDDSNEQSTPPSDEQQQPEDEGDGDEPYTPTDERQEPADGSDEQPTPPSDEQQQPEDEGDSDELSTQPTGEQQPSENESQNLIDPPALQQQPNENAAPTDIDLTNASVVENLSGAVIGTLTVVDPDSDESHSFAVSDDRFEVANGQLKLKDGVSLDFEAAASLDITVTATDDAGNQLAEIFTIGVTDVNEAPTAGADVTVDNDQELYTSQLGKGQTTLGSGDDMLHIDTKNFSPVRMGDGYDTIHLSQQGRSFDHQDAVKLENVEAIDTTGYGTNNVSLSIHDVLNMTDSDNRLTIIGDEGDTVTLSSSGNNQWTVVESNAAFTTYAYSDPAMQAVVEISSQLNAQVS
jgi:VCBS repeat-containing protein